MRDIYKKDSFKLILYVHHIKEKIIMDMNDWEG